MKKLTLIVSILLFASPLIAASQVKVAKPWSRPAQVGQSGAVFLQMSGKEDKLLKAECKDCEIVELHTHITEKVTDKDGHTVDVKRMRPVPYIQVYSKGITELKKGGLHIMLLKMKRELKPGDTVDLKLVFEDSDPVFITAKVNKCCGGCHSEEEKKA